MTFVIKDLKSFSIVEGEGKLIIHIAVPEYIDPCRMTVTRQIDQIAIVERENFKVVLKDRPTVDF